VKSASGQIVCVTAQLTVGISRENLPMKGASAPTVAANQVRRSPTACRQPINVRALYL